MSRQFLQPLNPSRAELLSDASPATTGTVTMGDGSVQHIPAPGSLADQLGIRTPLTRARTSGTAATRDAEAYDSFGAAHEGPKELTR